MPKYERIEVTDSNLFVGESSVKNPKTGQYTRTGKVDQFTDKLGNLVIPLFSVEHKGKTLDELVKDGVKPAAMYTLRAIPEPEKKTV